MPKVGITRAVLLAIALGNLSAQEKAGVEKIPPLVLTGSIPLPNVQGRIDHMSIDLRGEALPLGIGKQLRGSCGPGGGHALAQHRRHSKTTGRGVLRGCK